MPVTELGFDNMNQPQRKTKLPPEFKFQGTDRLSLGREARVTVVVAVLTANKDSMGEMRKYNGSLVHNNGNPATYPADKPLLGWVIAETPQAGTRGRYMALLVYKEGLNMIMLGQVLGRRIIDICHAADEANLMDDT